MSEFSVESFFTPEIISDPYPLYNSLREGSPALYLEDSDMVILSSYDQCHEALRDKQLGHNDGPDVSPDRWWMRWVTPVFSCSPRSWESRS